jgi:hypothetical protein
MALSMYFISRGHEQINNRPEPQAGTSDPQQEQTVGSKFRHSSVQACRILPRLGVSGLLSQ